MWPFYETTLAEIEISTLRNYGYKKLLHCYWVMNSDCMVGKKNEKVRTRKRNLRPNELSAAHTQKESVEREEKEELISIFG